MTDAASTSYEGARLTLPPGYSLEGFDASGLTARNSPGDLLQFRAQPSNLPGPLLALAGRNRDMLMTLIGAQAPALLKQALAAQGAPRVNDKDIKTEIVSLPTGKALFASTRLLIQQQERTLALWLLASPKLDRFYILSLFTGDTLPAVQQLMSPVLDSLRFD